MREWSGEDSEIERPKAESMIAKQRKKTKGTANTTKAKERAELEGAIASNPNYTLMNDKLHDVVARVHKHSEGIPFVRPRNNRTCCDWRRNWTNEEGVDAA
jgi:hypothetical protein